MSDAPDIAAVAEIERRTTRLRLSVMVPGLIAAFLAAVLAGYLWVELGWGMHWRTRGDVSIGGVVVFAFAAVVGGAWALYRALAVVRTRAWLEQIGAAHGVPAAELAITAAPYLERGRARVGYARWLLASGLGLVLAVLWVMILLGFWTS